MEKIPYNELKIIPLAERHNLAFFKSRNAELNDFLKNGALKDQEALISQTYLCFWRESLVGFIALAADTLEVKVVNDGDGYVCSYCKYPCLKIARLAVDRKFEGRGVGRFMLLAAIGKAIDISKNIGCRYITVDSKPESMGFYEKHKFKIVDRYRHNEFPKMYLNMYPIVAALRPRENLEDFTP